jgi:hypothetical protein
LQRGNDQCAVDALRGHASGEPELALLATTLRRMNRLPEACSATREYVRRYKHGARVQDFEAFVRSSCP